MMIITRFELNASDSETKAKVNHFDKSLSLSIQNTEDELNGIDPDTVRLYYLDEHTHNWKPLNDSRYDADTHVLTATTDHFSNYGEIGNSLMVGPGMVMENMVDLHSGAATFSYPLELPPGPGGFQPKLELMYNSASIDEMKNKQDVASWVGTGWSLNFARISYNLFSHQYFLEMNGLHISWLVQMGEIITPTPINIIE
jgi:hypothetical protein